MHRVRKSVLALTSAGMVAVGLTGLAEPAHAAAGDFVECYNGNYSGYQVKCFAYVTGSQIKWTFNGMHLTAYDGKITMLSNCGTKGTPYTALVDYIDSTTGAPAEVGTSNTCGAVNQ